VLLCRAGEQLYAYQGECAACGRELEAARLDGARLSCASCGSAFDLRLAGRRLDGEGAGLQPIPLLQNETGVRIAAGAIGA
jgi:nitrite reductase/ring-hydroxylating ferredoxin subunit